MYIYMYMYIYIYTYICIHMYTYVYMCTYICIHLYIFFARSFIRHFPYILIQSNSPGLFTSCATTPIAHHLFIYYFIHK